MRWKRKEIISKKGQDGGERSQDNEGPTFFRGDASWDS